MKALFTAVLVVACTKANPDVCHSDADCTAPSRPFCDIDGQYDASGHITNTCIATPPDCPAERCGCMPGTARCMMDDLLTCNADGHSETATTCALGCSTADDRCFTFEPSNGLGPALAQAANEPDVVLAPGSKINTTTGVITTSLGATLAVKSEFVTQGNRMIAVFIAKSFVINDAVVFGTNSFAAVAAGDISVLGLLDASANGTTPGPGAQDAPAPCVGANGGNGGGGAGNLTPGGSGATGLGVPPAPGANGGSSMTPFAALIGGCRGGALVDGNGNVTGAGGAGGGAVQLVSGSSISIRDHGFIHVGGGGGAAGGGGGSGGNVLLEAPRVAVDGPLAGVAANGGGGGGCGVIGPDATADAVPATAPGCGKSNASHGGVGAAGSSGPGNGSSLSTGDAGGGGGALGQLKTATRDGAFATTNTPVLSAGTSAAMLTIN